MRRVAVISLLLHAVAGLAVLVFLHWRPPAPPAEPARIEMLFGPGGATPPTPPARGTPPAAPPVPQAAGTPDAAAPDADLLAAPATPPGPAPALPAATGATAATTAPARSSASGVRVDQPDPLTIPARDDPGNHAPDYPAEAARQHWQGRVLLRLHIGADGNVGGIDTLRSSGHAVLDEAAAAVLAHWHFLPAQRDGKPIAWDRDQPVDFVFQ